MKLDVAPFRLEWNGVTAQMIASSFHPDRLRYSHGYRAVCRVLPGT